MISNLLIIKTKSLVNDFKSPLTILAHFLMALMAVVYGFGLHLFIDQAADGKIPGLTPDVIIFIALSGMVSLIITRGFLPTYTPQRQIFPKFYPLSSLQNYCASVVQDYTKPLYFYLSVFIAVAFVELRYEKYLFLVSALSVLYSALFIRRIIQYPIDFILSKKGYLLVFGTILALVAIVVLLTNVNKTLFYSTVFFPFALFYLGYLIESEITAYKTQKSRVAKREVNIFLKLLINCPNLRAPLLMSLVLKGFALFYFTNLVKRAGADNPPIIFVFLFASPFALFANIFNNTWGFWKGVWLNYELRTGSFKLMVIFMLRLVAIPLLVDLAISLPFLFYMTSDYLFISLFYTTALIALISSSLLWSLLFPIAVQPMKAFQMKKNTTVVRLNKYLG